MKEEKISVKVIERLTKYLRKLAEMNSENYISSAELAQKMGYTAAQVRKDLSNFGEFGIRGKGYQIGALMKDIENILGINKSNNVVVIGAGRLGEALLYANDFSRESFKVVGVFDADAEKVGKEIQGLKIANVSELAGFLSSNEVDVAILTVPTAVAQEVAEVVVAGNVPAILNFAPVKLEVPSNIAVGNIDFYAKIQELNYWKGKKN